jgi:hypothetical protein
MHLWHIIAGIYTAGLLFALALIRVASPAGEDDVQTATGATESGHDGAAEQGIIDTDQDQTDASTHPDRIRKPSDSRPGARTHRSGTPRPAESSPRV